ncbi:amidohydrolase family protein [Iocasia frigidifontis]|uniref:5-methylthioadenosine/S-adenosylhomocysteine deaminase n=1 Tax=Iocasia fonsfrigidae TaxID=2682810 RepID=A0A8A7KDR7_9FIRM|nr:amidohydrolase [Iocasia fonsfrigidae]QTL98245.1 amidohydrolase family protein [Iocasia fonsfrigidae]
MEILIKNIDVIYSANQEMINNGYIIIKDKLITEVGSGYHEDQEHNKYDQVIDGRGKIALPGLVNCHTHAGMTLLRGYADDLPLNKWLNDKIWPYEAGLNSDDIYWGTMLAIIEMIRTGTTLFADMYFSMDLVAKAVQESGIRAVLSTGLIEANDGRKGLIESLEFSRKWMGGADGRITTMLGPHAPYTCSEGYLREIIDLSNEHNLPVNIHLAETKGEYAEIEKEYGLSPVKYLNNIGLFSRPVVAAHCVYLDDEDIDIMASNQVGVVYNPASNMKLGSGIAPICKMIDKDIKVGIGSDGVSSNNNLDLIEEARLGSYLQKVDKLNPTVMDVHSLLKMLTLSGSRVLQLGDNLGIIAQGNLADIILVNISNNSFYYPHHNNLSNLFYAGSGRDVDTVIINGKIVMNKKNILTIDVEKIYYEVERIIKEK